MAAAVTSFSAVVSTLRRARGHCEMILRMNRGTVEGARFAPFLKRLFSL